MYHRRQRIRRPRLPPPFALGFGPTGIDLFEAASSGDIFALPLMDGGQLFLNTALHLPLAVWVDRQLMTLRAGCSAQDYPIDMVNPFILLIEPAIVLALMGQYSFGLLAKNAVTGQAISMVCTASRVR